MTEPVWLELFHGIKGKREDARLAESKEACLWLAFDDACWTEAAATARACLRAGLNVPFGDGLVSACARRYEVELWERDRHFAMITKSMEKSAVSPARG
jgi:predicted nucleic acid-binding protein